MKIQEFFDSLVITYQSGAVATYACTHERSQVAEMRERRKQGALIKTLMKDYDPSKASVYRYLSKNDFTQSDKNVWFFTRLGRLFFVNYVFRHTPPFPLAGAFGDSNEFVSLNSRHSWVFIPRRISNSQISDATDANFSIEELRRAIQQNGVFGSFLLVSLSCSTSSSAARLIGNLVGKRTGVKHYIILTTALQPSSRVYQGHSVFKKAIERAVEKE